MVAFFVGLVLALKLTFPIALRFFGDSDAFWIIALVIFIVLFFLVVWAARMFAVSIKKIIDFTPVGIIDNILGVAISVVKWLFIVSTLIWVMNSVDMQIPSRWIKHSDLFDVVESISPIIVENVGYAIPWFEDVVESMHRFEP